MRAFIVSLGLLLLASPAWSATDTLGPYLGMLTKQPIVARFDENGVGRYFYRKFGREIGLVPLPDGGNPRRFAECPPAEADAGAPCAKPGGYWSLEITPETIRGSWSKSQGGVTQAIELHRVGDARGEEAVEANYQALRLENRERRTLSEKSAGSVAWKIVQDTGSKLTMPFLSLAPNSLVLQRVNQALETSFRQQIQEFLDATEYSAHNESLFANERYFSVGREVAYYYPGTAHPSNHFSVTTFDLGSGGEVDWAKYFRYSEPGKLDLNRKDALDALALRHAVAGKKTSDDCMGIVVDTYGCKGTTCDSDSREAWILYPTTPGLAVDFNVYPEVARACRGEHIVIPWTEAKGALLKPMPLP